MNKYIATHEVDSFEVILEDEKGKTVPVCVCVARTAMAAALIAEAINHYNVDGVAPLSLLLEA